MATTSTPNTDDPAAKTSLTSNDSLSYFQKTVCLRDWWLVMAEEDFEGKRLAVAGLISLEKQAVRGFSSAPILKRHDMLTLETVDGIYVLIGSRINKGRTKENGFPTEVLNHFIFGFPTNWEQYADKCLAKVFSNKDVSTTLGRDKLFADSGAEGTADRSKSDISEERNRTSDKGFELQNHVTDCFAVGVEFPVGASIESPLPKSSDLEVAHRHKTVASMNLRSSCKRSDTPKRNDKTPARPQEVSLPTIPDVEGTKIPQITENIMDDTMKCLNMDTDVNPTRTNPKRRINSRLKNLTNTKNTNGDEENLNSISAAGTARSVGKRGIWDGISLSGGRTSNCWLSKRKSKLKDGRENVNPPEYGENRLNFCSRGKYDNLSNAAVNGEKKPGRRITSIPSGVGLQPTDGETEQMEGNITSQAGKQSNNMNRTLRSSISLSGANQIDDFQIAVSKKQTDVESARKSRVKSKRKLTYESPLTKGGTEKPSFVSPESSNFRRSRSGRLLLPALEFWNNQLVIYDADRQITGIQEGLRHVDPYKGSRSEPQRKRTKLS